MFYTFYSDHKNQLVTIIGGLLLFGLVLSAWIPQPCPLLRQAISNCPHQASPLTTLTDEQREVGRVGHQDVTASYGYFSVKSQDYRPETHVHFEYRADYSKEVAYLQVRKKDGFVNLALITHPLVANNTWSTITNSGFALYQADAKFTSIEDFLKSGYSPADLAADPVAAEHFGLTTDQYTPLEPLTTLGSLKYILTSYSIEEKDGTWRVFEKIFNLSDALVSPDKNLEFVVYRPNHDSHSSFLLSTVHVDYKKIKP